MKLLIFLSTVALVAGDVEICEVGTVFAEGKIKMDCTEGGKVPVACLPYGEIGRSEIAAGSTWSDADFKYECKRTGGSSLAFDIIACILPSGAELLIGQQAGEPNKGLYLCIRGADGLVTKKYKRGCFINDQWHQAGTFWTAGSSQVTCAQTANGYEVQASGCIVADGSLVQVGFYVQDGQSYFKCAIDGRLASQSNLAPVSAQEYNEWAAGIGGGELVALAGGNSGSGYSQQHGSQAVSQSDELAVANPVFGVGQSANALLAGGTPGDSIIGFGSSASPINAGAPSGNSIVGFGSSASPINAGASSGDSAFGFGSSANALAAGGTSAQFSGSGQCRDAHPVCKTLCSNTCTGKEQPVGLALKHFSLSSLSTLPEITGGRSSTGQWLSTLPEVTSGRLFGRWWKPNLGLSYWGTRPSYTQYRPSRPALLAQSQSRCMKLSDSVTDLINGFCPRSCGHCGSVDLESIAVKLTTAQCALRTTKDEPVGFALTRKSGQVVDE